VSPLAWAPGSPGSDLRLARQLQAHEERRRTEEAKLEEAEFKKLKVLDTNHHHHHHHHCACSCVIGPFFPQLLR